MDSFSKIPVPQKKNNNSIFEVVLLIIVIGLGYFFLVQPKQAELAAAKDQYTTLLHQQEAVDGDKQKLASLVQELKDNQEKIAKLDAALPLNSKITLIYIMFNKLSQYAGVTVTNLSVNGKGDGLIAGDASALADPFKKVRGLGKATVSMSVTGTFSAFENFLKQLEENGRIINVTSVQVADNGTEQLNFQLTMETYFYE